MWRVRRTVVGSRIETMRDSASGQGTRARGVMARTVKPGEDFDGATGKSILRIALVMAQWECRQGSSPFEWCIG